MSNPSNIEMTTFSRTEITRARSGSFTGHTIDSPHGVPSGNASFSYSQSRREMDLTNIVSGAPGGGARMMQVAEEVARSAGATSMVTAKACASMPSSTNLFLKQTSTD